METIFSPLHAVQVNGNPSFLSSDRFPLTSTSIQMRILVKCGYLQMVYIHYKHHGRVKIVAEVQFGQLVALGPLKCNDIEQ